MENRRRRPQSCRNPGLLPPPRPRPRPLPCLPLPPSSRLPVPPLLPRQLPRPGSQ